MEIIPMSQFKLGNITSSDNTLSAKGTTYGLPDEGGRNVWLASLAGSLRRKGVSEETLVATLLAANSVLPSPLPDEEVALDRPECRAL